MCLMQIILGHDKAALVDMMMGKKKVAKRRKQMDTQQINDESWITYLMMTLMN